MIVTTDDHQASYGFKQVRIHHKISPEPAQNKSGSRPNNFQVGQLGLDQDLFWNVDSDLFETV